MESVRLPSLQIGMTGQAWPGGAAGMLQVVKGSVREQHCVGGFRVKGKITGSFSPRYSWEIF